VANLWRLQWPMWWRVMAVAMCPMSVVCCKSLFCVWYHVRQLYSEGWLAKCLGWETSASCLCLSSVALANKLSMHAMKWLFISTILPMENVWHLLSQSWSWYISVALLAEVSISAQQPGSSFLWHNTSMAFSLAWLSHAAWLLMKSNVWQYQYNNVNI
jgi:hypothetical protein